MKILFLSLNDSYGDYITDALMYGLILEGHDVLDIPKRQQCYKDCPTNFFKCRNLWHYGWIDKDFNEDKRNKPINVKGFDLIIMDNASLWNDEFKGLNVLCLQTNDPITRAPMPNTRLVMPMGIKEKCLQSENINIDMDDFPLNHTVLRSDCRFIPYDERDEEVFMAMSIYGEVRKEFAYHFENRNYTNKEDYFNAIRKCKYGISIYGEGYNCQRDPELGGNTLLCKYRHPDWVYDETSYRDGETCIEFSSYEELMGKIEYYNNNPIEYNLLLLNCYEHTVKYYTMDGQAKRLLKWKIKD